MALWDASLSSADFWEVLTKETREDTGAACHEHFKVIGDCLEEHMNVLLSSESCHGANVMDLQGASRRAAPFQEFPFRMKAVFQRTTPLRAPCITPCTKR